MLFRQHVEASVRDAKQSGKGIHIGRLFDICVLKGSELPDGHPNRKWKGRVVFGGNNVRDEYGTAAIFPEQGSGASYAPAAKLLDAVSHLPGNCGEQSDAPAAYTQSEMYEQDIEKDETADILNTVRARQAHHGSADEQQRGWSKHQV